MSSNPTLGHKNIFLHTGIVDLLYLSILIFIIDLYQFLILVTHKAVRPGARPHVPPVMAEGDFRLMTPLYDNLQ